MYEDREAAQSEVQDELKEQFSKATISKLAFLSKQKESGEVKHRIIVDLLRAGGNLRAWVPERIVLPRICDLSASIRKLGQQRDPQGNLGSGAFWGGLSGCLYALRIDEREVPHLIALPWMSDCWCSGDELRVPGSSDIGEAQKSVDAVVASLTATRKSPPTVLHG